MAWQVVSADKIRRLEILCRSHPIYKAAEIVGINESTAGRIVRRGFTVATPGPPPPPRPADFSLYSNRMNNAELKRHYNAGGPTIRRWLIEQPRRPRVHPSPTNKVATPSREVLIEALKGGVSAACAELGITGNTLRRLRREHGLPIRAHKSPRQAAEQAELLAHRRIGWAERYVAERRAA